MAQLRDRFAAERPNIATRQASQLVIDAIAEALPNLLGGSADLTHSNLTRAKTQQPVRPDAFDGSYIHYGVREHAMAAAMNGIALHGGFIPYGGTFLAFADYSRPGDPAGGADGHARHPCDDARLRSASARTVRPISRSSISPRCARSRTCWCSVPATPSRPRRPGIARCGRRPARRCCACRGRRCRHSAKRCGDANRVALGAYVVVEPEDGRDVTLIATGSEVSIALRGREAARERRRPRRRRLGAVLRAVSPAIARIPGRGSRTRSAGRRRGRGRGRLGALARRRAANSSA